MLYGEGFIQPGNEVRVIGKIADLGSYYALRNQIVIIYGPRPGEPDKVRVKRKGEDSTWWVYCDDIEETHIDNEGMQNNLREVVPKDERPLPRII